MSLLVPIMEPYCHICLFKYTYNNIIYPDGVFSIRKMVWNTSCILFLLSFNSLKFATILSYWFWKCRFWNHQKNTFFHIFFIVEPWTACFLNIKIQKPMLPDFRAKANLPSKSLFDCSLHWSFGGIWNCKVSKPRIRQRQRARLQISTSASFYICQYKPFVVYGGEIPFRIF